MLLSDDWSAFTQEHVPTGRPLGMTPAEAVPPPALHALICACVIVDKAVFWSMTQPDDPMQFGAALAGSINQVNTSAPALFDAADVMSPVPCWLGPHAVMFDTDVASA